MCALAHWQRSICKGRALAWFRQLFARPLLRRRKPSHREALTLFRGRMTSTLGILMWQWPPLNMHIVVLALQGPRSCAMTRRHHCCLKSGSGSGGGSAKDGLRTLPLPA